MSTYIVYFEGTVREVYEVEADSEAEAREKWSDTEPFQSEVLDGGIDRVEVVDQ